MCVSLHLFLLIVQIPFPVSSSCSHSPSWGVSNQIDWGCPWSAAFIAVRTILIVEVIGLDRLTNAFGFLLLFQGLAIIAAPPLLGKLPDSTRILAKTSHLGYHLRVFTSFSQSHVKSIPCTATWNKQSLHRNTKKLETDSRIYRIHSRCGFSNRRQELVVVIYYYVKLYNYLHYFRT